MSGEKEIKTRYLGEIISYNGFNYRVCGIFDDGRVILERNGLFWKP